MPNFRRQIVLDGEPGGVALSAKACYTPCMEFTPTAEQDNITAAADTGENVVVTAVAGSGKTSTLKLIARKRPETRFLYLAFGKDIQIAMKDVLPNVESRTAHSVALQYVTETYPALVRKMKNDPKPWDIPARFAIPTNTPFEDSTDGTTRVYTTDTRSKSGINVVPVINATITKFCHTADETLTKYHVPREFANNVDQDIFARFILKYAEAFWADLNSPNGFLKFGHDHYLKVWSLDCPVLNADCILFDEAQDADPAISHVVENQPTQVIMVGDASQAIYGWRGAVDALSKFEAPHRLTLTKSFRFGPAIAELANRFLGHLNAPVRVVGNEDKDSSVAILDHADAILCRTNAGVIEYAIDMLAAGKRVAIAGGTKDLASFIRAADKLQKIERGEVKGFVTHAELGQFKTWSDAVEYAGGPDGGDIRIKVNLVQKFGASYLLEVLTSLVDVKDADPDSYDVVISTAHKAKGLEWNTVKIGGDFKLPAEADELPSPADLMLMYVALTRAMVTVDPGVLAGV